MFQRHEEENVVKSTMLFIFHAKLKRGVSEFVIKMDESSCQISAIVLTLQIHMVRTRQFSGKVS